MTATIAITRKSAAATLQINSTTCYMQEGTWQTTPGDAGRVIESFNLVFTGTDGAIRTAVELLGTLRSEAADFFADPLRSNSIWFSIYNSTTTKTRRALIYGIEFAPYTINRINPTLGAGVMVYTVTVERDEVWENAAYINVTVSTIPTSGGLWVLNPATYPGGSMGGRIDELKIIPTSDVTTSLYRAWIGIQPYYSPITSANIYDSFDASMLAVAGTAVAGAWATDADSPAGSPNCQELTSLSASATLMWTQLLSNHAGASPTSNYYRGKWLVLARVKANSGTVGLQLRWGRWANNDALQTLHQGDWVYCSNTAYRLIELGTVIWPSVQNTDNQYTVSLDRELLQIYCKQISGTTTEFRFDELILIPANHMVKLSKTDILYGSPIFQQMVYTREDGVATAQGWMADDPDHTPESQFVDWRFPREGGYLVFAAEAEAHHIFKNVNFSLYYTTMHHDFVYD